MRELRRQWVIFFRFVVKFLIILLVVALALLLMGKILELSPVVAVIQEGKSLYKTVFPSLALYKFMTSF